jgi:hypothetical protein
MIKNNDGERTTPKQLAQEIIIFALDGKLEFLNEDTGMDDLTVVEFDRVADQFIKQYSRIRKMFGWPPLESWEEGKHG